LDVEARAEMMQIFLNACFGEDFLGVIVIWTKDGSTKTFRSNALDQAMSYALDNSQTKDVYFGLGLLKDKPFSGRGKAIDVIAIPGFWSDIDIAADEHKADNYPPDLETVTRILDTFPFKPTMVVWSGYGLHCYWLFRELWSFETAEDREYAAKCSKGFQLTLIESAKKTGFKLDNTSDLSRILRLPGTSNHKNSNIVDVKIIEDHSKDNSYFYNPSDFEPYFKIQRAGGLIRPNKSSSSNPFERTPQKSHKLARLEPILSSTGCRWLLHCQNDATHLSEPEWHKMMTVIACCENSGTWAHELSKDFPGYDYGETQVKLEYSQLNSGPITCEYVKENFGEHCEECNHNITSPILLGRGEIIHLEITFRDTIGILLHSIESGDRTAHFESEVLKALAFLKITSLKEFSELRSTLKSQKCPLSEFDSAIKREEARIRRLIDTEQSRDIGSQPRPPQSIYDQYILDLDGTGYLLDESGNLCCKDDLGNSVVIANFIAKPTKEVILDDGVDQQKSFVIEGVKSGGIPLSPALIPAQEFTLMNWPIREWGIKVSIKPGLTKRDKLRDSIQMLSTKTPTETVFTHLGWRQINDKWVYLHAGGCIGDELASVSLDEFATSYTLSEGITDLKSSCEQSLRLLDIAPRSVTIPLLALIYLAPLLEATRIAKCEPRFLIWLYGLTGTRKTTLAMLFLHHFGTFSAPPASFKDTANALERRAFTIKDSVLLIDDYHPSASPFEVKKMEGTAQYILRLLGDRITKGRMLPNTQMRKGYPPRGMALITGEEMIQGESSVARSLAIELKSGEINLERLTEAQAKTELLAGAMRGYLESLAPQMSLLPTILFDKFVTLRTSLQKEGQHGRIAESISWLQIGLEYALSFFEKAGAIHAEEKKHLREEGLDVLLELAERQTREVQVEKPVQKFLDILRELLANGAVWTKPLNMNDDSDIKFSTTQIGWSDKNFYYLLPEVVYTEVNNFLSKCNETKLPTSRTLWKRLDEAGVIKVEMENTTDGGIRKQHLCKKVVNSRTKERHRLLHLKRDALNIPDDDVQNPLPTMFDEE